MQIPVYNPCAFSTTATSLLLVSAQGESFNSLGFKQSIKPESLSRVRYEELPLPRLVLQLISEATVQGETIHSSPYNLRNK